MNERYYERNITKCKMVTHDDKNIKRIKTE